MAVVPGSRYKSFANAYVDESDPARPTLWVFGTSDCAGWNAPTGCAFNMSLPGHPWMPCECPGGGTVERGEVWAMWSYRAANSGGTGGPTRPLRTPSRTPWIISI